MNEFIVKNGTKLRIGYTTGSCAAAAAKAAACMLLTQDDIEMVTLTLPSGQHLNLEIEDITRSEYEVTCAVRKDAGDDPDVTHNIKIYARVRKTDQQIRIDGGEGVGRVTREGLACQIGEAAINPVPKKMMEQALKEAAEQYRYQGGFDVLIFVPEGEKTAKHTFNARLGIIGGISILGTTGIVEPMSEAAIIETIRLEINAKSNKDILFVSPGNYGLEFAKSKFGLDIDKAVKCSNYIGETLDYAAYCGVQRLLLIGHIGKLVKLAGGVMNTHSKTADCRNEIIAAHTALYLPDSTVIGEIMNAGTTDEIHKILEKNGMCQIVYKSILKKIVFHLNYRVKNKIQFELMVFSNENGVLMKTEHVDEFINEVSVERTPN